MIFKYVLIFCSIIGTSLPLLEAQIKNNIFDLNGVLFLQNKWHSIKNLRLSRILRYAVQMKTNPMIIKSRFFKVLDTIFPRPHQNFDAWQPQDNEGVNLPYIMQEWIKGTQNGAQILEQIKKTLATHPHICRSNLEKELILQLSYDTFDPQAFVETQTLHPDAVKTILELKKQGYKLFVLSNWNPESFILLRKKYAHFFDLFDGIMISDNGYAKPNPLIYEKLLAEYQLNPQETIFIDDQAINIKAAQQVGIHATLCPIKKKYFKNMPDLKKLVRIIKNTHMRHAAQKEKVAV
jgi:HAD superfamily hydrolase (TIGR01509 family)